MKRKQFSEEQIIGILKEAEAGAVVVELCRKRGMSSAIYYARKAKFGGLEVSNAKRLRALEEENVRLKGLLADTMLDNTGLKDLLPKKMVATPKPFQRCCASSGPWASPPAAKLQAVRISGRRWG